MSTPGEGDAAEAAAIGGDPGVGVVVPQWRLPHRLMDVGDMPADAPSLLRHRSRPRAVLGTGRPRAPRQDRGLFGALRVEGVAGGPLLMRRVSSCMYATEVKEGPSGARAVQSPFVGHAL